VSGLEDTMAASITIFLGCMPDVTMTTAIKGIAMWGIAHADTAYRCILAGIIVYMAISIFFPLYVELSDYHCRIHDRYFNLHILPGCL